MAARRVGAAAELLNADLALTAAPDRRRSYSRSMEPERTPAERESQDAGWAGDDARELDAARAARLREMRGLTMSERLSRFQRLCVETSRIGRAGEPPEP